MASARTTGSIRAPHTQAGRALLPFQPKSVLIAIAAIALLAWAGSWLYHRYTYLYLDDARVDGEVVTLSSRVSGWVTEVSAIEGDDVKKGQVLVRIDERDSRLQREVLSAKLASLESQMAVVRAQIGQVDEETLGKYQSETSHLAAAEAELASRQVQLKQSAEDLRRTQELADRKWLSQQAMERARTTHEQAREDHRKALSQVAAMRGTLSAASGSRKQLRVLQQQLQVLLRKGDELRAEIRRQEVDIADRNIVSPADGKVVMTFVRQGEHVATGQRILMFHDPNRIWIEANVKETDIGLLRHGMKAAIHVDAYPGRSFRGEVYRIGQTATSKFALLPDPNPSGNFTKVTQRLPVRILLAEKDHSLRPGMMVEVSIDVRNQ